MRFSCFLVLTLGLAALLGASSPASGSTTLGPTTTLSSDVVHYLSAATLLGAVPTTQQVTVGVVLNNPNQAAEDAYLAQLYDPSSANYQQVLDPDQFNAQFGVPSTTVRRRRAGSRAVGSRSVSQRARRRICRRAARRHRSRHSSERR